jgi:hypothetical protein
LVVEVAEVIDAKHISVVVVLELVVNVTGPPPPPAAVTPFTSEGELIVGVNETAAKAPPEDVIELLVVRPVVATVTLVSIPWPYVELEV